MDAVKLAVPFDNVFVARVSVPYLKVTVPDGVDAEPVTVALRVTFWPTVAGLGVAVNAISVSAFVTSNVAKPDSCPPHVRE